MRKFISIFHSVSLLACFIGTPVYMYVDLMSAEPPPQDYVGEDPRGVGVLLIATLLPFVFLLALIPTYSIFIKRGVFSSGSMFLGTLAILHDILFTFLSVCGIFSLVSSGEVESPFMILLIILLALGVGSIISVISALRNP